MPKPMYKLTQPLCALLIGTLLSPSLANAAPKPLDPGTVHVKVMKRGVGNFIAVQEQNGVQLFGRILAIHDHSFTMQLHNDPQTTEINYTDVEYLQTGFTTGQKVFMAVGIGGFAAFSIWAAVHFSNEANKPLEPPTPAVR
jgi:hypothetical protein